MSVRTFTLLSSICLFTLSTLALAAGQHQVSIKKFAFEPQTLTIQAGDSVIWTNNEKRQYHSVWFEEAGDPEAPYIFPGETTERKFETPGSYPYHCGPHPEMTGTIIVQ